jgi:hypothetical protein
LFCSIQKKYLKKIDNRVTPQATVVAKDTLDYIYKYQYIVNFNTHSDIIKDGFNQCMKEIENLGYLDSVVVQTRFARESDKLRMNIGYHVPFEISKAIISYLVEKEDDIEVILFDKSFSGETVKYSLLSENQMLVGVLNCSYAHHKKYLRSKSRIKELLKVNNQKEFIDFFRKENEENARLQKYLTRLQNTLRFPGCEDLENVEAKFECARSKYWSYISENFYDKIEMPLKRSVELGITFDEKGKERKGKLIDVKFIYDYPKVNKQRILDFWYAMPNWIPASKVNTNVERLTYVKMYHSDWHEIAKKDDIK